MSGKRTNFKVMGQKDFIAYLEDRDVPFTRFDTTTVLGVSVTKIKPKHFRLGPREFETKSGNQIDTNTKMKDIELTTKSKNPISKKQLIRIIDERVQNMGTKGVYHPKRLKPKWNSLTDDNEKLELFEKYVTSKESSIGFLKLIKVNLCHKTLEAVIIEFPTSIEYLKSNKVKSICIDKFSKYNHGKQYLIENGIKPSG
ncbi:hypothetical protein [Winogradskyella psychrotolerans]|uniref:hypothetical protein n=1 Tax=Winogradskyella psychrotolerans TaxID=1344585 RepID=UPI001C0677EB|nr:hypothetical protein [Winogradskyella psychrotolerans]MBU2926717.1 hypothetical protein [Winogradskyella psychrotolerans]